MPQRREPEEEPNEPLLHDEGDDENESREPRPQVVRHPATLYNPQLDATIMNYPPPVPFDGRAIQARHQFNREEWDRRVPTNGFINDFVWATKDRETTTQIAIWSALHIVSTVLKRFVWLGSGDVRVFPNLFIIVVAPPAIVRKTTAVEFGTDVLFNAMQHVQSPIMRAVRTPNIVEMVTPESLIDLLKPQHIRALVGQPDGRPDVLKVFSAGSNASMVLGELTAAINRVSYNAELTMMLTRLYDGSARGMNRYTLKHKKQNPNNIYFNMFAATTPDEFISNTPANFLGGGMASRTTIITESEALRRFDWPEDLPGLPTPEDLSKRLAWIIDNVYGEYHVSDKAKERFSHWRTEFFAGFNKLSPNEQKVVARQDIIVKKIALLMACQKYQHSHTIDLQDMEDAIRLVDMAYKGGRVHTDLMETDKNYKFRERLITVFKQKNRLTRRALQTATSRYMDTKTLKDQLTSLLIEGCITITGANGELVHGVRDKGNDEYAWVGPPGERSEGQALAELASTIAEAGL